MAQAAIAYRKAEKSTRFLVPIENHWRDTPLREITAGAIRQSALTLYPKASNATRNRQVIAPTQAIINHAATLDWCAPIKVKRFPVEVKPRDAADLAWINAFATQAVADGLPHLGALCLFMFGTGARVGEAVRMVWAHVDLIARTATMSGNKPRPWVRTAHLPGPVLLALTNLPSNREPDEPVFRYLDAQNLKQAWDSVVKRAGVKRLTPHCCRHGFATTMLRAGYDVKTVAKMGGWRDASIVLKHYAHAIEDRTVTEVIFGTDLTQSKASEPATKRKKRGK